MRIALAALAALSLAACSKPAADTAAPAPAVDASAPAPPTDAANAGPQADPSAPGNPAIKDPHADAGPPAKGANSFTEAQARTHIENSGFTSVTGLTKDDNGLWHGTATKDGKTTAVSVDFKGNVVAQ